jgi:hypothetical protein
LPALLLAAGLPYLRSAAGAETPAAETPVAVPVDGPPFRAKLTGVDAGWLLTFDTEGKTRSLPAADLVSWGHCAESRRGPIVVLADGGLLVADVLSADKQSLSVDSGLFGPLKLPWESLAGVVFLLPAGRQQRDLLLDRVLRAQGASDRLLLANGDEVAGLVNGLKDRSVQLQTDVGPVQIESDRIAALILNPALRRPAGGPQPRAWAGWADGSRLLVGQLVMDTSLLRVTIAAQAAEKAAGKAAGKTADATAWKTSAADLVFLQPIGGRATYLSDLKPAGYRHVPYLDLAWPFHNDRNVVGGRLRCDGRTYLKGLGMHSASRLSYALDAPYARFQAELAVDDATGGQGSVRFRVFVDGRQKYQSEIVRGGTSPVPLKVDLTGAKRLDLVVDFADRADQLDHADWLDARLVK